MIPPVSCTPKYFKGCKTARGGEESYDSGWQTETALSFCCSTVSQLGWETNWIQLWSGDVSLSGSHRLGLPPFSAPLYQHDLAASYVVQTWYSMEGLEKCVCLKSHRLHLKRISSFNKHVCSCFSDRNCQLGSRQNSAFIHIFNIGLTHTEKKSITVRGLKVIT